MQPVTPLHEPIDEETIQACLKLVRDTGFLTDDEIGWVEQTLTRPEHRYDGFAILKEMFDACKAYLGGDNARATFRKKAKLLFEQTRLFCGGLSTEKESILRLVDVCQAYLEQEKDLLPYEVHHAKRVVRGILHARQIVAYKQRNVLVAVPQRVQHTKHTVPCLNGFYPGQNIHARVHSVFGLDYAEARNALVAAALSDDAVTHILFVDDDVLMPRDGLQRLLDYHLPIVSGTYCKKNPQLETGVTAIGPDPQYIVSQQCVPYEHGNYEPIVVSCTGGGFILFEIDVFRQLGEKPYEFIIDQTPQGSRVRIGEDSLLCQKAAAKGIKTAVVPGLCGLHVDFTKGGRGLDVETYGPKELVDPSTRRIRPEYMDQYLSFPDDPSFDVKDLVAPDAKDYFGKNVVLKEKGLIP
jgi:hypothetical protein